HMMRWFGYWFFLGILMTSIGLLAAHHVGLGFTIVDALIEDRLDSVALSQGIVTAIAIGLGLSVVALVMNSALRAASSSQTPSQITWQMGLGFISNGLMRLLMVQFFIFTLIVGAVDWNVGVVTSEGVITAEVVVFALSIVIDARVIQPTPLSIGAH